MQCPWTTSLGNAMNRLHGIVIVGLDLPGIEGEASLIATFCRSSWEPMVDIDRLRVLVA